MKVTTELDYSLLIDTCSTVWSVTMIPCSIWVLAHPTEVQAFLQSTLRSVLMITYRTSIALSDLHDPLGLENPNGPYMYIMITDIIHLPQIRNNLVSFPDPFWKGSGNETRNSVLYLFLSMHLPTPTRTRTRTRTRNSNSKLGHPLGILSLEIGPYFFAHSFCRSQKNWFIWPENKAQASPLLLSFIEVLLHLAREQGSSPPSAVRDAGWQSSGDYLSAKQLDNGSAGGARQGCGQHNSASSTPRYIIDNRGGMNIYRAFSSRDENLCRTP